MKKFSVILLLIIVPFLLDAQDTIKKNGISFKALVMDYQSQNGGDISAIKDYHHGFEIGYHRLINDNFSLNVPFKFGNVNRGSKDTLDGLREKVYGLDIQGQYSFKKPMEQINPYALLGVGVVSLGSDGIDVQVPVGLGVSVRVAPGGFINLQAEYRQSFIKERSNLHYGLGFKFFPGQMAAPKPMEEEKDKDSDGDGISDKLDLCPDIAGLKLYNGCPDSDGDGIPDYQDKCPKVAGTKALMGCPDSDGDGISDNEDECPSMAGTKENKGCPEKVKDTDGDGVNDDVDKCPDQAGTAANNGCPEVKVNLDRDGDGVLDKDDRCPDAPGPKAYNGCPDTDGDGLDDSIDRCPKTPGTVAANGCPEITKEDKKTLDVAMRAVQFDTGKNTLKSESYTILRQIVSIMNRYPDYNLVISGHTDNVGSAIANQDLSERRARACLDYLVGQGVQKSRLSSVGYGESRPVSSNDSEPGRTLNRRVEFTMLPR
ncbi:MAG: OmpA family protein [Saprospiraceae bacterium]